MIGFVIATIIVILKLLTNTPLFETAFIQVTSFLFWWYVATGVSSVLLATLAWAGDLGTEGARMRVGIATPISWMIGLSRTPLNSFWTLLFLIVRRGLFVGGAYLLTQSVQAVGAAFAQDNLLLLFGGISIMVAIFLGFIRPQSNQQYPNMRMREA